MIVDYSFAHDFEVQSEPDWPSASEIPTYEFRGDLHRITGGEMMTLVLPTNGMPWFGTFQRGDVSPHAANGIYSCPSPHTLCVVALGLGYLVDTRQPEHWRPIVVTPVINVVPMLEARVLIFSDFNEVAGYSETNALWRTGPICSDDLYIRRADAQHLDAVGYDAETNRNVSIHIDAETGHWQPV